MIVMCTIYLKCIKFDLPFYLFQVAAKKYCGFDIPTQFTGVWRYLQSAYEREEFKQTCPADIEIEKAYFSVANKKNWTIVLSVI